MKLVAWRIFKARHAADGYTGEGARRFGGRWNSRGVPLIYTSQSQSLAALEMLVHLESVELLQKYLIGEVEFDEAWVERLSSKELPPNWRACPAPRELCWFGDRWAESLRSPLLQVPSAVVEGEYNYLINPLHPDFPKLGLGRPRPFEFDPRLMA